MGMTVVERTREIGTLRAMGLKRRGVTLLFSIEGFLIGLTGCLLGLLFTLAAWITINGANITYIPPNSTSAVPFQITLVPESIVALIIFFSLLSLFAAFLPARRAAKLNVVDSLAHV